MSNGTSTYCHQFNDDNHFGNDEDNDIYSHGNKSGNEEEYDNENDVTQQCLIDILEQQEKWYKLGILEDCGGDTEICIQRYFKIIYRQVNFFQIEKKKSGNQIL